MDNLISLLQESPGAVAVVVVLITAIVLYIQSRRPPIALSQDFQAFTLSQKEVLSHDTRRFTFAFPNPKSTLGLPVGQHMTLMFEDEDGKHHQRSYTPVSHSIGQVSFVIKIYMAGVNPKFPNGGKVSQHLESLKIGDSMMMKGPKGHLHWLGRGKFTIKKPKKALETRHAKEIGMIAGGTGITPMLQILHAIFQDSGDTTCCKLLYANQTEEDILVRDELEFLAKKYPTRFQLHYTVDRAPKGWTYSEGFVTKEMIAQHVCSSPSPTRQIFMCGPPPMIKFACLPNLKELGFEEKDYDVF